MREGVSLVLTPSPSGEPVIAHWGAALGPLDPEQLAALGALHRPGVPHSALDRPRWSGVVPQVVRGFSGTPALEGVRPGATSGPVAPRLDDWSVADDDAGTLTLTGSDREAGWDVEVTLSLDEGGLLTARTRVTNSGAGPLQLVAVRTVLPVAPQATELLDLTGRWTRERHPQRHPWVQGTHVRESRHGRTGHDASLVMVAGVPGFGFGHGELWGVHTAWSGDHTTYAERTPEGECVLGSGELLGPGEVVLEPGESYTSPRVLGSYSVVGLDGMAARLHAALRAQSPRTRSVRPVVVNTWEAAYFDHDLDRLGALAEAAAEVGAERFVLDDGWFLGRRHDRAGLGDWQVDPEVWPKGLHPLIERVHALGMDFGLWVEPEMVNEDSELARAHPDWILRGRTALPEEWRFQQVLDLQVPEAYAHVRDGLTALLDDYDISYLKWDHNRDLVDVSHAGRPAVHGQTQALHRLLDELREAHPALEIESCASGGGRVDAEILARTDRIWPSDTIDALERQHLQTWTSMLVPPELIGSHIGGPVAHTTGRRHSLGYRGATALLFHLGIEWDLSRITPDDRAAVRDWVDLHKRVRPLVPTGRLVHADHPDPAVVVTGLVAEDAGEAWYVAATVAATATQHPAAVRLPGLAADATYRVTGETPRGRALHDDAHRADLATSWLESDGLVVPGAVLGSLGVRLPVLSPETAQVIRAVRVH
ncbi:alpha-galactosidase [Nocardioides gansuensis]|uniref:alpha-galactosidase n=2 Tax=Nocardioides gansuensis TaxID=2138300 RepID=A0A2T8F7X6_9ACTN|nr:alpha-galactosidase [Nocardioides gansuensis]